LFEFKKEEIEQSIPVRFEKIVAEYPHGLAVKDGDRIYSYKELNERQRQAVDSFVSWSQSTKRHRFQQRPVAVAATTAKVRAM